MCGLTVNVAVRVPEEAAVGVAARADARVAARADVKAAARGDAKAATRNKLMRLIGSRLLCNPPKSDPKVQPKSPTPKSNPKVRTPNQTTTPTGPRTDRTVPHGLPRPIGTLPAGPIAITTGTVDRAGQLGGTTEQGVMEGVPKLCTEA